MKNILAGWLFLVLVISLPGCKSSFLDLEDKGSISENNFPTSLDHLDLLLVSVYGVQHERGFMGYWWHGYSVFCLDHTVDMQWRNDDAWIGISTGMARQGDNKVTNQWRDIQKGIYFANSTLEGIARYRTIAPAAEKQAIDNKEGEALFMRGFYLWHLEVLYGQPDLDGMGVPIVLTVPKDLAAMSVPRATTRECYQAMINDFKQASVLLEGQTDNHRATKWSACLPACA